MEAVRGEWGRVGLPQPRIMVEPGRSIVGRAGDIRYHRVLEVIVDSRDPVGRFEVVQAEHGLARNRLPLRAAMVLPAASTR